MSAVCNLHSNMTYGFCPPWAMFPKELNLTTPRANTPRTLSCVVASPDPASEADTGTTSAGLYVSVLCTYNTFHISYVFLERAMLITTVILRDNLDLANSLRRSALDDNL